MAGARIAMMSSALLRSGIGYLGTIMTELLIWMGEYDSIKQMQGSMSRVSVPQPYAFELANCMKVLSPTPCGNLISTPWRTHISVQHTSRQNQ